MPYSRSACRHQILHMGALELAQIGRLLDKAAVDDAGQTNADRVHGLSGRHRPDLLGKALRDSLGRQAEQRLVVGALLVNTQLADQLVPFHQPGGDVFGGGDSNCPSHVFFASATPALPPFSSNSAYHFASLLSPLNAAAL